MTINECIKFLENNGYVILSKADFYQRSLINEMAVDRKFIQNKADAEFKNIIENWCLLKYVSLTNDKMELRNHWRKELNAALRNVNKYKLNNGNNRDVVYKAIYQCYIEFAEYDKLDLTYEIYYKFKEEQIETDLSELEILFKDELLNIIHLMAYGTDEEIFNYVEQV